MSSACFFKVCEIRFFDLVYAVIARRDDLLNAEGVVQGLMGLVRMDSSRLRCGSAPLLCRQSHLTRQVLFDTQTLVSSAVMLKSPGLKPWDLLVI